MSLHVTVSPDILVNNRHRNFTVRVHKKESIMSEIQNLALSVVSPNVPPTVNIIACGGGGINMMRRALPEIAGQVTYKYLDTSMANLQQGETAQIIGGGGSGLVRSLNVDIVVKTIASLSDEDLGLSDINIVVFSLSGGSGSVIGPLVISDIAARRKRIVIALTITSQQSEKHTENTLRTLQSLRKITDDNKLYLPISIFDNNAGQRTIDRVMPYKISRLVDLLTKPTVEVDKNDRLHWLDVPRTLNTPMSGLRLLHVVVANDPNEDTTAEIWPIEPGHIYDSLLSIRTDEYEAPNRPRARASFEGMFSTIKLVPVHGVIGNPPGAFDALVKRIKDTLNEYNITADQAADPFTLDDDSSASHRTGIVL